MAGPAAGRPAEGGELPTVSPIRARSRELDEACAQAVDLARAAAQDVAGPGQVGEHDGAYAEGDRVVTHLFASLDPAYAGWRWAVTVARASRSKVVTVSEAVLLPGRGALMAPDWVPWSSRVRPGDLGVGDLLPAGSDDERLVPVVALEGDDGVVDWDDAAEWAADIGLADAVGAARPAGRDAVAGRSRVLSAAGRDETAVRWYASEHGPASPLASAAPGPCVTCGFMVSLGGPLGRAFGACANEYAPDDGRVVSFDHGCGAHSDAGLPGGGQVMPVPVIDEIGFDVVDAPGVSLTDTVFESLDHG